MNKNETMHDKITRREMVWCEPGIVGAGRGIGSVRGWRCAAKCRPHGTWRVGAAGSKMVRRCAPGAGIM